MLVTVNGLHMTQHKLIHAKKGGGLLCLKKQLKIKTHEGRRKNRQDIFGSATIVTIFKRTIYCKFTFRTKLKT